MVDLLISGSPDNDAVVFSLNGESKTIDRFSNEVLFSLEEGQPYRLKFEQKSEQFIPHYVETFLNILFLPIRGTLNVLTFNTVQEWEKDISAFKISGYIDINLSENTQISFDLTRGKFDKNVNRFYKPTISFFPDIPAERLCTPDVEEIIKKHHEHLLNIVSTSVILFALMFYLLFIGFKNKIYTACVIVSLFIIAFGTLTVYLILFSFKKRKNLITTLTSKQSANND